MAEYIARTVRQIIDELFEDHKRKKDGTSSREESALKKYAKLRWVHYEIDLHFDYGLEFDKLNQSALAYFSKTFLYGKSVYRVSYDDFGDGCMRMRYAEEACRKRCTRLVRELNVAFSRVGLDEVHDIDKFLDFLTYDLRERKDEEGNVIMEKPYNFPVVYFANRNNLRDFTKEIRTLVKDNKMLSMVDVYKNMRDKRIERFFRNSVLRRRNGGVDV